jgi:hypothetical protein
MEQAVHAIDSKLANTVEIVVHISDALTETQRENLVTRLEAEESITSAEFCPLRYHLMLVRYDRDIASSHDVLDNITAQNHKAQLIGPI